MSEWRKFLGDQRGVALPLAMILLLILTMLAITFMSLGAVEPQISQNQSDGARARQLAEAGVEWGYIQVRGVGAGSGWFDLSTATNDPSCPTAAKCVVLVSNGTLPGLTATQGTFTVAMRNDVTAGEEQLTGYIPPGAAAAALDTAGDEEDDQNGVVILTSTGRFNQASRTVTAVIQRGTLDINGALTLPGVQSDAFTNTRCPSGNCPPGNMLDYTIDGRDWKRTDVNSPTGIYDTKLGIAVQPGMQANVGITYEENTEKGFKTNGVADPHKAGYVQGTNQTNPSNTTTGLNTIAPDTGLNPSVIQSFLNNVVGNPSTQIIQSTQACAFGAGGVPHTKPEGLRMTAVGNTGTVNIRNNCSGSQQINQTLNLGSSTAPVMIYIKGEYDPTSNFIGVAADGNDTMQGYGILIVEDADMSFFGGNFRWDGIVIVTGQNVGVGFRSGSSSEVRGALIGNETNGNEVGGYFEFLNQANAMRLRRSKENIDMALNASYNMRISTYREN